ncbi:ODF3L2, partial [Cordylochernes scorpioides]
MSDMASCKPEPRIQTYHLVEGCKCRPLNCMELYPKKVLKNMSRPYVISDFNAALVALQGLTGFEQHAINKKRAPCYTIKGRYERPIHPLGPGPAKYFPKCLRTGCPSNQKRYPFLQLVHHRHSPTPGPYSTIGIENITKRCSPAYTFGVKNYKSNFIDSPGPARYGFEEFFGKGPGYFFGVLAERKPRVVRASPGCYELPPQNLYKPKAPAWKLYGRLAPSRPKPAPSPLSYVTETIWVHKVASPSYTFGQRHSSRAVNFLLPTVPRPTARCRHPGPASVGLPTLVGYRGHDFTKERAPMFTMRVKPRVSHRGYGPGPGGYSLRDMGRKGIVHTTKAIMIPRRLPGFAGKFPGPADYPREKCDRVAYPTCPAYSMPIKGQRTSKTLGPGPAAYSPAFVVGQKKVVQGWISRAPQYSMRVKHAEFEQKSTPGPAAYQVPAPSVYKERSPDFSLRIKYKDKEFFQKPGPSAYRPEQHWFNKPSAPRYTFGIKHRTTQECEE